jgi:transposase
VIDMDLLSVIRRWYYRDKIPIRDISRRTGLSRNTIRKYVRADTVEPIFKDHVPARGVGSEGSAAGRSRAFHIAL